LQPRGCCGWKDTSRSIHEGRLDQRLSCRRARLRRIGDGNGGRGRNGPIAAKFAHYRMMRFLRNGRSAQATIRTFWNWFKSRRTRAHWRIAPCQNQYRGRRGLVARRNLVSDGKNPRGSGAHGNPFPSRDQRDHVAPDGSGPLLSLVRAALWPFRSAPRLIRLLCCAAFQSRLQLRSRAIGRVAIGLG
jgi:hypothetical protein